MGFVARNGSNGEKGLTAMDGDVKRGVGERELADAAAFVGLVNEKAKCEMRGEVGRLELKTKPSLEMGHLRIGERPWRIRGEKTAGVADGAAHGWYYPR